MKDLETIIIKNHSKLCLNDVLNTTLGSINNLLWHDIFEKHFQLLYYHD